MLDRPSEIAAVEYARNVAKYIAVVVRNAMEDFRCRHRSDAQMGELNPIIRNAIFTALYAFETRHQSKRSKTFIEDQIRHIPKYWEEPEFVPGFKP